MTGNIYKDYDSWKLDTPPEDTDIIINCDLRPEKITDIEISGIDMADYPDFCDAYLESAVWIDTGIPLTDDELDELQNEYSDWFYSEVQRAVF